jgi:hypothetical protein
LAHVYSRILLLDLPIYDLLSFKNDILETVDVINYVFMMSYKDTKVINYLISYCPHTGQQILRRRRTCQKGTLYKTLT